MYIVDSGILIRDLRGDLRAGLLLNALEQRSPVLASVISVLEVARGETGIERTNALFARVATLDLTYDSAIEAARLMRTFRGSMGGTFAVPDALIAGTALVNQATLVTLNRRQFGPLADAGLDVILIDQDAADWTTGLP